MEGGRKEKPPEEAVLTTRRGQVHMELSGSGGLTGSEDEERTGS